MFCLGYVSIYLNTGERMLQFWARYSRRAWHVRGQAYELTWVVRVFRVVCNRRLIPGFIDDWTSKNNSPRKHSASYSQCIHFDSKRLVR